jgi:hypothetical protein
LFSKFGVLLIQTSVGTESGFGAWRMKHARYYWLLLAEGHLTRRLFGSMLRMMAGLPLPNQ